jgi:predicted DNA-binding transcriptional regulator AlpA
MTTLPPLLADSEVCNRIGITTMTLHRWLNDPEVHFPRPIQVKRLRLWPEPEVAAWLNEKRA